MTAIGNPNSSSILIGDFATADDLLGASKNAALAEAGEITIARSGRLGPLVEMIVARRTNEAAFARVTLDAPFAQAIDRALDAGTPTGLAKDARAGVFPLQLLGLDGDHSDEWRLWLSRADQAAKAAGFPDRIAAELAGALGELQDNVFRHSQAYATGLSAFAATPLGFEMVVSDAGCGVLASLHTCAE